MHTPLDVTVLRSGIPDTVPGRTVDLCERGIAAMLAGELMPGETVGVEVELPMLGEPLRARATVKYHDKLRCGFEFVSLTEEQLEAIREVKGGKAEGTVSSKLAGGKMEKGRIETDKKGPKSEFDETNAGKADGTPSKKRRRLRWVLAIVFLLLVAAGAGAFWWRWNRAWEELESGLKGEQAATAERPQAQVPAEVMQKLLVHRVEPVYPMEARRANLQGVIALDIVVGRDGSVTSVKALNGPEVLVKAAMDALRWWKFEPYKVNGEPAVVETTVAVEFKR